MKTIKTKLVKMITILATLIVALFICIQSAYADDGWPPQNYAPNSAITKENLEGSIIKNYTYKIGNRTITKDVLNHDTVNYLQLAAERKSNLFFTFNAQTLVNHNKNTILFKGKYDNYHTYNKQVICVSPAEHNGATEQLINCIMDIEEGKVTVYTKGKSKTTTIEEGKVTVYTKNGNTTTTDVVNDAEAKTLKSALNQAHFLAYLSYMSTQLRRRYDTI